MRSRNFFMCILLFITSMCFSQILDIYGSVGSFGLNGTIQPDELNGSLFGSLFDLSCIHNASNIGIEVSPFNIEYDINEQLRMSFINFSLFHRTFALNDYSFIGPFAKVCWLDFNNNKPEFLTGVRLLLRDELMDESKQIKNSKPLIFKLIGMDIGIKFHEEDIAFYTAVSIDAVIFVPLLLLSASAQATEDAQKFNKPFNGSGEGSQYNDLP